MGIIELDGRTGEGGGQLVRVAVAIAALTTQPIRINHIRGNRGGGKHSGLKSQHLTAIKWLAQATEADVEGLSVGSSSLSFKPRRPPTALLQRNIRISAESSAASTLLMLQAILPFLVFAGNESGEPIILELSGGTNVSFSLSYEYLDQVFLPTLAERFGVTVERELKARGWSMGSQTRGSIWLKFLPLPPGQKLQFRPFPRYALSMPFDPQEVKSLHVSLITPTQATHQPLQQRLALDLEKVFGSHCKVDFVVTEESHSDSRWYVLVVAHSQTGLRWGRDVLRSKSKKDKSLETFIALLSRDVTRQLHEEVMHGGEVDEHLQDQLVCFQALCEGHSSFQRTNELPESTRVPLINESGKLAVEQDELEKDGADGCFGDGSLHTRTARWVVSRVLRKAKFFEQGNLVKGAGISIP